MRPTDLLCLACEFRVAINAKSDMTTVCKFKHLQFFASCHYPFHVFDVKVFSVVPQVLKTWLTCFCWHVTWNSWIISIEIARKCLFNKRFSSFLFPLVLAEKFKSLVCPRSARESDHFQHSATNTNVRPCCIMACGWFFRRTCFNYIPTLVHPLVLQLREYPLKPVTFTLCHFYLSNICPLFFSSQLSSFSAACFSASIQSLPDASLCGVLLNRARTSMGCLKARMTRWD